VDVKEEGRWAGERGVGRCPINLASELSNKNKIKQNTLWTETTTLKDKQRRIVFRGCALGGRRNVSAISSFWGRYKLIEGKTLK
jgi:hypothetical protein